MTFRDDKDAKTEHAETLEKELAGAREELARTQARIAELEAEVLGLRQAPPPSAPATPSAPTPPASPGTRSGMLAFAVVACGFVALVSAATVFRTPTAAPVPLREPAAAPAKIAAPRVVDSVFHRPARATTATWPSRVKASHGATVGVGVGAACSLEAALEEHDDDIHVAGISIRCGATNVYDSRSDAPAGHSAGGRAREALGGTDGSAVVFLDFHECGGGASPEVSVDTEKHTASLWRYETPSFRLDLTMPAASTAVPSGPLLDITRVGVHRGARVVAASTPAPATVGARCDVRVAPRYGEMCDVYVGCGGVDVYGRWPFSSSGHCNAADALKTNVPLDVADDDVSAVDHDPRLEIHLGAGTVTIADAPAGFKPWKLDLAIDAPDAGR